MCARLNVTLLYLCDPFAVKLSEMVFLQTVFHPIHPQVEALLADLAERVEELFQLQVGLAVAMSSQGPAGILDFAHFTLRSEKSKLNFSCPI